MYVRYFKYIKSHVLTYFTRLNIARQMFFGYLPLVILIIATSAYVLYNLNGVNRISQSIVGHDTTIMSCAEKLADNLIGQESYGQRYVILQTSDMIEIFWKRSQEFEKLIKRLGELPKQEYVPLEKITRLHDEYNNYYRAYFNESTEKPELFARDYEIKIKDCMDLMIGLIESMSLSVRIKREEKLIQIGDMGRRTFYTTSVISIIGILFGILAAFIITKNISRSVNMLKDATAQISEGNFDQVLNLKRHDELGDLAVAFSEMAGRLSRWEEMYLDASPLTRLPGGVAIDNVLKKRLKAEKDVSFCLLDLDNFKSFNDKYGYAMGNRVIKKTAKILEKAIKQHGTDDDFLGHIGGDDFAIITSPGRYIRICRNIVDEFDKAIVGLYDPADHKRGFIAGKTRQGNSVKFPIMTLSIAVVSNDDNRHINHLEIGEIAAELKEHAKLLPGSQLVTDRRNGCSLIERRYN